MFGARQVVFLAGGVLVGTALAGAVFLTLKENFIVDVGSSPEPVQASPENSLPESPFSAARCEQGGRRPVAVVLAADPQVRPLSGIDAAELVIELPVTMSGITRFIGFYVCQEPSEIGSVRSAREYFIPVVAGFDAIFAHWGGSHFALAKLDRGVVDNLNALINPAGSFWRKPGLPAPDNGFTSVDRLIKAAQALGYRTTSDLTEFAHRDYPDEPLRAEQRRTRITIDYPEEYKVRWEYDTENEAYIRYRGSELEIDALTSKPVRRTAVVVLLTSISPREGQYNSVEVTGEGRALIFYKGKLEKGSWQKNPASIAEPLKILDSAGKDFAFPRGKIWISYTSDLFPVSSQ